MARVDARAKLAERLVPAPRHRFEAHTSLRHLALVNYAVDPAVLAAHIPADRFDIPTWIVGGVARAFVSVVPFWDQDFRFVRFAPCIAPSFGQTNYRAYVIDRTTGEHVAWFFGTTLGSVVVNVPRRLWGLPWHSAKYELDCEYEPLEHRYGRYRYQVESAWGPARVELEDTGVCLRAVDGFDSFDEAKLVLTHPIEGYYLRRNGRLGGYSIRHPEMELTVATPVDLWFGALERLGLVSPEQQQRPHSVWITPSIEFQIVLPPKRLG